MYCIHHRVSAVCWAVAKTEGLGRRSCGWQSRRPKLSSEFRMCEISMLVRGSQQLTLFNSLPFLFFHKAPSDLYQQPFPNPFCGQTGQQERVKCDEHTPLIGLCSSGRDNTREKKITSNFKQQKSVLYYKALPTPGSERE